VIGDPGNRTAAIHESVAVVGGGRVEPPAEADCGAEMIFVDGDVDIIGELVRQEHAPSTVARCGGDEPPAVVGDRDGDMIIGALGGEPNGAGSSLVGVF
jgi:hypothetical protein